MNKMAEKTTMMQKLDSFLEQENAMTSALDKLEKKTNIKKRYFVLGKLSMSISEVITDRLNIKKLSHMVSNNVYRLKDSHLYLQYLLIALLIRIIYFSLDAQKWNQFMPMSQICKCFCGDNS